MAEDNGSETGTAGTWSSRRGTEGNCALVQLPTNCGDIMRIHIVLLVGFALGLVGCAEKEQAAPEPEAEMEAAAPETVEAPEVEAPIDETVAVIEEWRDEGLLDHMHAHAEQLDEINYALDDGDLEAAMTPAYWMSRHKTVRGLPDELQPFVDGMRSAALDVEGAKDIVTAKAAAQRIAAQCQGCHAATGVSLP